MAEYEGMEGGTQPMILEPLYTTLFKLLFVVSGCSSQDGENKDSL